MGKGAVTPQAIVAQQRPANASRLAGINHVVAKEKAYLGQVNGRLNVSAAMLERDFTVTGTLLERGEDGAVKLGAFDLTHKTYGRLLSVDGDGNVNLFDQAGNAMDAAPMWTRCSAATGCSAPRARHCPAWWTARGDGAPYASGFQRITRQTYRAMMPRTTAVDSGSIQCSTAS